MAIWYTRERMKYGPVFGNKDFFEGLAVIIDTYSNHNGEHNVYNFSNTYLLIINKLISFFFYSTNILISRQ